jgi:hypothetical protein
MGWANQKGLTEKILKNKFMYLHLTTYLSNLPTYLLSTYVGR